LPVVGEPQFLLRAVGNPAGAFHFDQPVFTIPSIRAPTIATAISVGIIRERLRSFLGRKIFRLVLSDALVVTAETVIGCQAAVFPISIS
jgi:hypothetical protein